MRRRIAAWTVTGPLGHLAAGIADWTAAIAQHVRSRFKRRSTP